MFSPMSGSDAASRVDEFIVFILIEPIELIENVPNHAHSLEKDWVVDGWP
jgi:hypothetical protein